MVAVVDFDKCKGHEDCVDVCPDMAITMEDGKAIIDPDLCEDCGECVYVCPEKAIAIPEAV